MSALHISYSSGRWIFRRNRPKKSRTKEGRERNRRTETANVEGSSEWRVIVRLEVTADWSVCTRRKPDHFLLLRAALCLKRKLACALWRRTLQFKTKWMARPEQCHEQLAKSRMLVLPTVYLRYTRQPQSRRVTTGHISVCGATHTWQRHAWMCLCAGLMQQRLHHSDWSVSRSVLTQNTFILRFVVIAVGTHCQHTFKIHLTLQNLVPQLNFQALILPQSLQTMLLRTFLRSGFHLVIFRTLYTWSV